ncbi:MAG: hypothetical protein M1834_008523 [Cirrosporium novae-zelandiae]|nr:MAG: hypothetical protein M1834_008523 [Cirrosporium novae-zelandiae]
MAHSSTINTGSPAESHTPGKAAAPKDRQCNYCQQWFTSSSLGRHLDLFIKESNPKLPDGIHDVEEIRRLRRGITRRQARNSSTKRESTVSKASPSSNIDGVDTLSPNLADGHLLNKTPPEGYRVLLNQANWQATGVINGLPGTMVQRPLPNIAPKTAQARRTSMKTDFMRRQENDDEVDTGRAIELALKELLGNIKAANMRSKPPSTPFTAADPLTMTFPALCLQFLPPPPTLFSTAPLPSPSSWSIDPPGPPQLEALTRCFHETINNWKMSRLASITQPQQPTKPKLNGRSPMMGNTSNQNSSPNPIEVQAVTIADQTLTHLTSAFTHWKALPDADKISQWRLELARAFASARSARSESDAQLVRVQHEAAHLHWQIEQLNQCQFPKEFVMAPPREMKDLPDAVVGNGPDSSDVDEDETWSFESIVGRWKDVVQRERFARRGLASQRPLPQQRPQSQAQSQQPQTPIQQQQQQNWANGNTGSSTDGGTPRMTTMATATANMGGEIDAVGEDDNSVIGGIQQPQAMVQDEDSMVVDSGNGSTESGNGSGAGNGNGNGSGNSNGRNNNTSGEEVRRGEKRDGYGNPVGVGVR